MGSFKGEFTNWFELSDLIRNYSDLTLFSIAAITQSMAIFGVLNSINLLTWMIVGLSAYSIYLIVFLIRFWQVESAYTRKNDATYSIVYTKQYK